MINMTKERDKNERNKSRESEEADPDIKIKYYNKHAFLGDRIFVIK